MKTCLASDNCTPAHPLILEALAEANMGFTSSYEEDPWTLKAIQLIQEAFQKKPKVHMVPTGTGANVLALKIACRRFESAICTNMAHLCYQEAGAAEAVTGIKLLPIPHHEGKLTPATVKEKLQTERAFGKHGTLPRLLSITQPTEVGTVYSREELKALAKLCKEEGLLLHIDGSRLYNALVHLDLSPAAFYDIIPVDILSLGGTKNGLMGAEALVIFNPLLQEGTDYLHKQTLQLLSKTRYLSTQYIPFFKQKLWHTLALHANQKAAEIARILQEVPALSLSYPVESNQIFFTVPSAWIPRLQEMIYCYIWDEAKNEIRFVTSWNTSDQDVLAVKNLLRTLS